MKVQPLKKRYGMYLMIDLRVLFAENQLSSLIILKGTRSKLFNYFRKDHPGKIITYSDRRLFTGNLYRKLFSELTPSDPGYSYSNNVDRIPRYEMTKKKLSERYPEDSNLPESMIANKHGYYKIYDCGQFRFESIT